MQTKLYRRSTQILQNLLLTSSILSGMVFAQSNYPNHTIQVTMPLQAGSAVDVLMRPFSQKMSEVLGQSMIIENITGGAGLIGANKVAQANPDGYVLGAFNDSILNMVPNLYKKVDYDPLTSFTGISQIAGITFVLVANPNFKPNNIKQLIEYAKANPGKLDYASGGNGSPQHIGMEMLRQMTGAPLVHIPYKGAAAPVTDVMAGQVPMMISALAVVLPHIKAGKLKAIAITSSKRSLLLPDVPTVAETVPGYELMAWAALVAPKGTPNDVINKLNDAITQVLKDPKMKEQIIAQGFELVPTGQAAYNQANKDGFNRMRKIIKDGGISLD
ncbi:Bug family tripartite tricarboxylate transporter substrate binding protein [Polynucleobacter kasalickyi]|uniref:Tripartite-type tricarboxylate transporter, receptor component TctC n=1 Tax=Polynucleobacter kasalickyi TaxID=1938817 RepID=A0A1W1Y3C1_9BURK|nr:tripartite tricarboxylate transporter substrate binding protein [Polynucleobacter kasalickyi]SMC30614.1 Tripartite-type tricarboxylate transporter, receptor component TctC [Polynucleobacter kasalickyi]